ncbi:hypothetical protein GY45DRAFT_1212622, partial [Cubamyces sp. BRFM 1775]
MSSRKQNKRQRMPTRRSCSKRSMDRVGDTSVEHCISPEIFSTYLEIGSVTLPTVDGQSTEIIRVGDIIVTLPTCPAPQRDGGNISNHAIASIIGRVTPAPATQAVQEQEEIEDLFGSDVENIELLYHGFPAQGYKATCKVQELWHARVTSLRDHEGQRFAKLTWFYRVGDLKGLRLGRQTRAYVKTLASAELVYSNHFTINSVECIFGKSPMVEFTLQAIDLRTLGRNDTFTRGDMLIIDDSGCVQMEICWDDGCKLGRTYTPGSDAIRFCDNPNCQRWFHAI